MYIKNIYMAPPVAYERQACFGHLHHACKNTTCSKVSKLGRPSINKICYTVTSVKTKKHFNTFVIAQLVWSSTQYRS